MNLENIETGIDITSIERIIKSTKKHGVSFLEKFLLPSEIFIAYKHSHSILKDSIYFEAFPTHIPQKIKIDTFINRSNFAYEKAIQILKNNFDSKSFKHSSLAGFWAAKESISKALGFGIGSQLSFHDICIYKDTFGKPHVALNKDKFIKFSIHKISISISHDGGFAIAFCAIVLNKDIKKNQ